LGSIPFQLFSTHAMYNVFVYYLFWGILWWPNQKDQIGSLIDNWIFMIYFQFTFETKKTFKLAIFPPTQTCSLGKIGSRFKTTPIKKHVRNFIILQGTCPVMLFWSPKEASLFKII
jgi:hypothetical protein